MSNKIQPVRGTQDLLPETSHLFRTIDSIAHQTSTKYGYEEIDTPIFEFSEVFHRSLGETSDAVSKETYDFLDRGGDKLTLRPEGTAGVVRAFISNGMAQNLPLKLYYSGPMFRYERPQKGRYRQFHQIGVEALGYDHPFADVESIALGHQILSSLGLKDKIQLEINTLGDKESRDKHREALVNYLLPREKELSQESQIRLHKNPLRILDSKDEGDKKIVAEAPGLQKFLNDTSKKFYDSVIQGLQVVGIDPVQNEKLVRGLDYYTHTVFEFTTTHLGAQGTVLAGGRYDGLVAQLGGPQTPGVGWASGMERLSLLMEASQFKPQSNLIAIIPADEKSEVYCLKLSTDLRRKNHFCEYLGSGNVGKKMKRANKLGAKYAIIVGETEMNQGLLAVKDLTTGEQKNLSPNDFEKTLI